jgi:hypothetical protein
MTQDHRSTSPDKNTTRVPPGTRHRSAHVDTPSTVGPGLAAPAPTTRNTATVTSRHIVPRRSPVALARTPPPCSPSPRRSYTAPTLVDAVPGHLPSLARKVFEPCNARRRPCHSLARSRRPCHENHTRTQHGVLQHRGHQKQNPQATQTPKTKTGQKSQRDTSKCEANTEFVYGNPQHAAHAATAAATPSREMTGNWRSGTLSANR